MLGYGMMTPFDFETRCLRYVCALTSVALLGVATAHADTRPGVECRPDRVSVHVESVDADVLMKAIAEKCGGSVRGQPLGTGPVTLSVTDMTVPGVVGRIVGRSHRSYLVRYRAGEFDSITLLSQGGEPTAVVAPAMDRSKESSAEPVRHPAREQGASPSHRYGQIARELEALDVGTAAIDFAPETMVRLKEQLDELEPDEVQEAFTERFGPDAQEMLAQVNSRIFLDESDQLQTEGEDRVDELVASSDSRSVEPPDNAP